MPEGSLALPDIAQYKAAMPFRADEYRFHYGESWYAISYMRELLNQGNSFTVQIEIFNNLFSPTGQNGVYDGPRDNQPAISNHMLCVVGFDDDKEYLNADGEKSYGAFKAVNSWGNTWGEDGFFWISYNAMADCFGFVVFKDRINYCPTVIAEVRLEHSRIEDVFGRVSVERDGRGPWASMDFKNKRQFAVDLSDAFDPDNPAKQQLRFSAFDNIQEESGSISEFKLNYLLNDGSQGTYSAQGVPLAIPDNNPLGAVVTIASEELNIPRILAPVFKNSDGAILTEDRQTTKEDLIFGYDLPLTEVCEGLQYSLTGLPEWLQQNQAQANHLELAAGYSKIPYPARGNYTLLWKASNSAGSCQFTLFLQVDPRNNALPQARLVSPENNACLRSLAEIIFEISDDLGVAKSACLLSSEKDGAAFQDFSRDNSRNNQVKITLLSQTEGRYRFSFTPVDNQGASGEKITAEFILDTTAPQTTISGVPQGWAKKPVEIKLTAVDKDSGVAKTYYSLNNQAKEIYQQPLLLEKDGIYKIRFYSEDHAGNVEQVVGGFDTLTNVIKIDTLPVQNAGLLINAGERITASREVKITITANDELSGLGLGAKMRFANELPDGSLDPLRLQWSGFEDYAQTKSWQLSEGEGNKTVYLQITDVAGNLSVPFKSSIQLYILPAAPTNLQAIGIAVKEFALSWKDNALNETGYRIERKLSANAVYELVAELGPNTTSYNDFPAMREYVAYYRVQAVNRAGASAYAEVLTTPTPPYIVMTRTPSASQVQIYAMDSVFNRRDGIKVERSGENNEESEFAEISVQQTGGILTDNSVKAGQTYYYRLRAFNSAGVSGPSEMTLVTIPTTDRDVTPPSVPLLEVLATVKPGEALYCSMSSQDKETGVKEFQYRIIEGNPVSIGAKVLRDWESSMLFQLSSSASLFLMNINLVAGKTYYFQVKARNGAGLWSAVSTSSGTNVTDLKLKKPKTNNRRIILQ